MLSRFSKNIRRGAIFIKENPELLYTVFLLLAIPAAFIVSSQQFLNVAADYRERLEKDRIGLMQDTFAALASRAIPDPEFLQQQIKRIAVQNENITAMKVASYGNGEMTIIASLDQEEIGHAANRIDEELFRATGPRINESNVFPVVENGERHWKAVRALIDEYGNPFGFILLDISMASLDALLTQNIRSAYIFLSLIVALIVILLLRHARIIDYTKLYWKLKAVDTMKDDFISIASHELRTPLTVISWQIDTLKAQNKEDEKTITMVRKAATELAKLVEDILDVSRIEQGRMKFELIDVDPEKIISEVFTSIKPAAEEKSLLLKYDPLPLPQLYIDPQRFRQVLVNLLSNAIKYTKQGSIMIHASVLDKSVRIDVEDTGIGISAENQKKLFQKFQRIECEETKSISGTGLGLWITREIVNHMHGTISIESIEGVGSRFTISFPVSRHHSEK